MSKAFVKDGPLLDEFRNYLLSPEAEQTATEFIEVL